MAVSETGAPYEVVAVCSCCSVRVLVGSTYPWVPPPTYKCHQCLCAEEEAAARRGKFQLAAAPAPPPVAAAPVEEGAYAKRARALGLQP